MIKKFVTFSSNIIHISIWYSQLNSADIIIINRIIVSKSKPVTCHEAIVLNVPTHKQWNPSLLILCLVRVCRIVMSCGNFYTPRPIQIRGFKQMFKDPLRYNTKDAKESLKGI